MQAGEACALFLVSLAFEELGRPIGAAGAGLLTQEQLSVFCLKPCGCFLFPVALSIMCLSCAIWGHGLLHFSMKMGGVSDKPGTNPHECFARCRSRRAGI